MGWTRLVVLGGVLLSLTAGRVYVYGDEGRVWADAVAHAPEKPRPWINLGRVWAQRGDVGGAHAAYTRAWRLAQAPERGRYEAQAGTGIALVNRALLAWAQGDVVAARADVTRAVAALPNEPMVREVFAWMTAPTGGGLGDFSR